MSPHMIGVISLNIFRRNMKNSTSLLIIDMQEGFITEETQHVTDNINNMLENNTYDIIIATKFLNYHESPFVKHLQWEEMIDNNTDLLSSVELASDYIVEKYGYHCGQELIDILKENHIDKIDIVGVDTDACVLANATYLFDNGFDITVYSKLCASTGGIDVHNAAIEILKRNIGSKNIV